MEAGAGEDLTGVGKSEITSKHRLLSHFVNFILLMQIEQFNHTIDGWISALGSYTLQQLHVRPDAESWSLGQVYMHLIDETTWYLVQMESCLAHKEHAHEAMIDRAKAMFANNEFPNEQIKGDPFIANNIPQPTSTTHLHAGLNDIKRTANSLAQRLAPEVSGRSATGTSETGTSETGTSETGKTKHPGLGYFSGEEWLQYAEMHMRHHLRQKERLDLFLKEVG